MKVLWKADLGQGKHDPLEVTHVVTKSGSQISAELVVPLEPHPSDAVVESRYQVDALHEAREENAGLLEVIDAQMAAIDELSKAAPPSDDKLAKEHEALKEWADQFPDMIEDLCMALGLPRNPIAPTGIPELDIIVKLCR